MGKRDAWSSWWPSRLQALHFLRHGWLHTSLIRRPGVHACDTDACSRCFVQPDSRCRLSLPRCFHCRMVQGLKVGAFLRRLVWRWHSFALRQAATCSLCEQAWAMQSHFALQLHFSEWKIVSAAPLHSGVDQKTMDRLWRKQKEQEERCRELEEQLQAASHSTRHAALRAIAMRRRAREKSRVLDSWRSVWGLLHASAAYFLVLRRRRFVRRCLQDWKSCCQRQNTAYGLKKLAFAVFRSSVASISHESTPTMSHAVHGPAGRLNWRAHVSGSFDPPFMSAVRTAHIKLAEASSNSPHVRTAHIQNKTPTATCRLAPAVPCDFHTAGIEMSPRYQHFTRMLGCFRLQYGTCQDDNSLERKLQASPQFWPKAGSLSESMMTGAAEDKESLKSSRRSSQHNLATREDGQLAVEGLSPANRSLATFSAGHSKASSSKPGNRGKRKPLGSTTQPCCRLFLSSRSHALSSPLHAGFALSSAAQCWVGLESNLQKHEYRRLNTKPSATTVLKEEINPSAKDLLVDDVYKNFFMSQERAKSPF